MAHQKLNGFYRSAITVVNSCEGSPKGMWGDVGVKFRFNNQLFNHFLNTSLIIYHLCHYERQELILNPSPCTCSLISLPKT